MTRRHYIAIAAGIEAEILAAVNPCERVAIESVARRLASIMGEDNPRFDRDRFLKFCGCDR